MEVVLLQFSQAILAEMVVSVESVCDAPSDGHSIDLWCCSPLWPDLDQKSKHTQWHRKPDLDSLHHLCLEMSLSLTRLFLTDTSLLYSSVQGI